MRQKLNTPQKLVYNKRLKPSERRKLWFSRIFIWIAILIAMFPIIAVISASMAAGETFTQTTIFPEQWSLENYRKVLQETDFLIWAKNSLILCSCIATIQLVLALTAAYAFSRMRFKGRKNGILALLILQMFPQMMAVPAILSIAYSINGLDNMVVLILILAGGNAFSIWLLKGFMDGIPKELDEAAMVDGCGFWQVFIKIILPLSKGMLAVIFLFSFIGVYSEFVLTSALMKSPETQTLATGMKIFITNEFSANWTQYSAAAMMASVPIVVIFMALQKFISKGLVAGAVKG